MPVKAHQASEYLKTPEDVAAYLNAAIEEMGEDPRLLMTYIYLPISSVSSSP